LQSSISKTIVQNKPESIGRLHHCNGGKEHTRFSWWHSWGKQWLSSAASA